MVTLSQFENQWYGKQAANNHGNFPGECVSLGSQWTQNGLGVPNADAVLYCSHTGGARDLYEQFDGQLPTYFDRLPYGNAPQDGDLVVWGGNMGIYGDVAIYIGSGQVFGQLGTPVFQPAAPRQLTPQPLGYLRLKGGYMSASSIDASDTDILRICSTEIGGWDFDKTHAGQNDALFLKAWAGHTLEEFIRAQWVNGAAFRTERIKEMNAYPDLVKNVVTKAAVEDYLQKNLS